MHLNWQIDPKQLNVQRARSAAYQYTLINYNDGRAEMSVQHRGDRPSETPIKRFVYRNQNGAYGGAQRFENKHGYADPAHHSPAEVVPFLPELPAQITDVIWSAQQDVQAARNMVDRDDAPEALFEQERATYMRITTSVLCCAMYDCYNRTEIDTPWCAVHRDGNETTED